MTDTSRLATALSGRYTIERELGAGGMATVYLARDVKHDRKVALKVMRAELAAVIGVERFLVEIKTTANLQHPHILPLHDSGEVNGTVFYVMPFIEGESLRDRLAREKQLPIADAIRITGEVAGALDYAHRHGIIHRDIKPENVLLHDGQAFVVDFGIAFAASRAEGSTRLTETGMSLGTPHYMSPEQAMGERDLDARTDVYALGCMLYEMLAGETPFDGPTAQAIIAKVMSSDPAPLMTLRRTVPRHVAAAVHTAIQKLPADRFPTAARFAEAVANPAAAAAIPPLGLGGERVAPSGRRTGMLLAAMAVVTVVAVAFAVRSRSTAPVEGVTRLALALPANQALVASSGRRVAFAPDGQSFVYTGPGSGGSQLWLRALDTLDATAIPGTAAATSPFFSPDGHEIGFLTLAPFALKVVPLAGGEPRIVTSEVSGGAAVWGTDGYIYFDAGDNLSRIHPDGTGREVVSRLDTLQRETGFAWPTMLPDDRGLLIRLRHAGEAPDEYHIVAIAPRTGKRSAVVRAVLGQYAPSGHLLYVTADGSLFAQTLDLNELALTGSPHLLWRGMSIGGFGSADLVLSPSGTLLYTSGVGTTAITELAWVTRGGAITSTDTTRPDGLLRDLAVSPDGSRIALQIAATSTGASNKEDIWVKQLGGGPTSRLTIEGMVNRHPTWSPDGREVFFLSNRDGGFAVYRQRWDGSRPAERVTTEPRGIGAVTVSSDGRALVVQSEAGASGYGDLLIYRLGLDTAPEPLVATPAREYAPTLSPDGRWLAYTSDESGLTQVYVRPFPDVGRFKKQVSTAGGAGPRWSPIGDALYYRSATDDLMAVAVRATPDFSAAPPERLFSATPYATAYDVSPDGQRFLMLHFATAAGGQEPDRLVIVQHFLADLERRLPR